MAIAEVVQCPMTRMAFGWAFGREGSRVSCYHTNLAKNIDITTLGSLLIITAHSDTFFPSAHETHPR